MSQANDKSMSYTLVYQGEEYTFQIDRKGEGRCVCRGKLLGQIQKEDPYLLTKGKLLGNKRAMARIAQLEKEFSFDVRLPFGLTQMLWRGWDTAGAATDQTKAFEELVDRMLIDVIQQGTKAAPSSTSQ
jgi:hypothetical protein